MKFQVKDIDWCIDREDVEENLESLSPYVNTPDIDEYINDLKSTLPTEVEVEVDDEVDIADYLSDRYGWLVNSFNVVNGSDDILTKDQKALVHEEVCLMLKDMTLSDSKAFDLCQIIIDDVITDIEETADWGNLENDEVCLGDIHIAVGRVIYDKITNHN